VDREAGVSDDFSAEEGKTGILSTEILRVYGPERLPEHAAVPGSAWSARRQGGRYPFARSESQMLARAYRQEIQVL
jgi:hypothetical protein